MAMRGLRRAKKAIKKFLEEPVRQPREPKRRPSGAQEAPCGVIILGPSWVLVGALQERARASKRKQEHARARRNKQEIKSALSVFSCSGREGLGECNLLESTENRES